MCTLPNPFPPYTNQPQLAMQIYNKKSQISIIIKYHNQKHLLQLQCGDIHPNPGPLPNMLQRHPPTTKDDTTYFLPSTIKFQPEYQHHAKTFEPLFQNTHHLHAQTSLLLPYLYNHIQPHNNHPPSHGSYTQ